ncbi:658_t:CDS:2 [Funneliformis geosporum]|uniref:658_t:CDS:1 n=1 Tax=Funneliformis geosporum TaxID=1117311 RepID=A0A9W4WMP3_9GLOM|nr:658_t:CDS:2 [Funneliformis geosporum]
MIIVDQKELKSLPTLVIYSIGIPFNEFKDIKTVTNHLFNKIQYLISNE